MNDCEITGCPSHKLQVIRHITSDTYAVEVDENRLHAIIESLEGLPRNK